MSAPGGWRRHLTFAIAWSRMRNSAGELAPRIPIGTLYLLSRLRGAEVTVDLRDLQLSPLDDGTANDEALYRLLQGSSDVLGISCMADLLPAVCVALDRLTAEDPGRFVILGGPGPSSVAGPLLQHHPGISCVVIGEGEETLAELLARGPAELEHVPGIAFRRSDQVVYTPPRSRQRTLDQFYPLPYEVFPPAQYPPALPFSTTRGCPYACTFCDIVGLWDRTWTSHGLDQALAELHRVVADRAVSRVQFIDDTFVVDRRRVAAVCARLERDLPRLAWHCNGRINLMHEDLLDRMARAGCVSVFYGVESGSEARLRQLQKRIAWSEVERVVRWSASRMRVVCSFIWGFPDETWDEFQQTRERYLRLAELPNVSVLLNWLQPLARAPLYRDYAGPLTFGREHWEVGEARQHLTVEETAEVLAHPGEHPAHYYLPTPDFEAKALAYAHDVAALDRALHLPVNSATAGGAVVQVT